jgi:hypothetical protein
LREILHSVQDDNALGIDDAEKMALGQVALFIPSGAKDLTSMKAYFVYMMTNRSRVVLYTGVTNSLERRL